VARFLIRLDDLCPTMDHRRFSRVVELLDRHDVRPLGGLVPDNHDPDLECSEADPEFWARMRELAGRGWRFAQHGYTHEGVPVASDELGLSPLTEFAGRPEQDQRERLAHGRELLAAEGLATDVFMAPFHSYDGATLRALAAEGFRYVTDGYGLFPFTREGLVFLPQLFEWDANAGVGVYTLCLHPSNMDEAAFSRLEAVLERRRGSLIDFDTAVRDPVGALSQALLELTLRWGISAARWVRSSLRG